MMLSAGSPPRPPGDQPEKPESEPFSARQFFEGMAVFTAAVAWVLVLVAGVTEFMRWLY